MGKFIGGLVVGVVTVVGFGVYLAAKEAKAKQAKPADGNTAANDSEKPE